MRLAGAERPVLDQGSSVRTRLLTIFSAAAFMLMIAPVLEATIIGSEMLRRRRAQAPDRRIPDARERCSGPRDGSSGAACSRRNRTSSCAAPASAACSRSLVTTAAGAAKRPSSRRASDRRRWPPNGALAARVAICHEPAGFGQRSRASASPSIRPITMLRRRCSLRRRQTPSARRARPSPRKRVQPPAPGPPPPAAECQEGAEHKHEREHGQRPHRRQQREGRLGHRMRIESGIGHGLGLVRGATRLALQRKTVRRHATFRTAP